ncbi:hypothetical protein B0J17DRAFT_208824 [Rhizoctonia solani]|nr:hypothetical protein B0J17DRAFT_208824 [Rhizoctonia solani]
MSSRYNFWYVYRTLEEAGCKRRAAKAGWWFKVRFSVDYVTQSIWAWLALDHDVEPTRRSVRPHTKRKVYGIESKPEWRTKLNSLGQIIRDRRLVTSMMRAWIHSNNLQSRRIPCSLCCSSGLDSVLGDEYLEFHYSASAYSKRQPDLAWLGSCDSVNCESLERFDAPTYARVFVNASPWLLTLSDSRYTESVSCWHSHTRQALIANCEVG